MRGRSARLLRVHDSRVLGVILPVWGQAVSARAASGALSDWRSVSCHSLRFP